MQFLRRSGWKPENSVEIVQELSRYNPSDTYLEEDEDVEPEDFDLSDLET